MGGKITILAITLFTLLALNMVVAERTEFNSDYKYFVEDTPDICECGVGGTFLTGGGAPSHLSTDCYFFFQEEEKFYCFFNPEQSLH